MYSSETDSVMSSAYDRLLFNSSRLGPSGDIFVTGW